MRHALVDELVLVELSHLRNDRVLGLVLLDFVPQEGRQTDIILVGI